MRGVLAAFLLETLGWVVEAVLGAALLVRLLAGRGFEGRAGNGRTKRHLHPAHTDVNAEESLGIIPSSDLLRPRPYYPAWAPCWRLLAIALKAAVLHALLSDVLAVNLSCTLRLVVSVAASLLLSEAWLDWRSTGLVALCGGATYAYLATSTWDFMAADVAATSPPHYLAGWPNPRKEAERTPHILWRARSLEIRSLEIRLDQLL